MIEIRIIEIIKAIRPKNVPKWFQEVISGNRKIPNLLKEMAREKAQEVYEELYS